MQNWVIISEDYLNYRRGFDPESHTQIMARLNLSRSLVLSLRWMSWCMLHRYLTPKSVDCCY